MIVDGFNESIQESILVLVDVSSGLAEPTGCSGIVNMDQIQTSPDLQRLVKFAGTMAH